MDLTLIIPLLLGWLSGWLVNYLADVLPHTRRFSRPACPHCQAPFRWGRYLSLRPCASCGKRRSIRVFATQAAVTLAAVLIWAFPHPRLPFALGLPVLVYLTVVLVIDLEHRLILHPVSIAGAVLGLGIGLYLNGPVTTLIGGAAGFGIMLVFYFLGEMYVRRMAKKGGLPPDEVALGFGDVNLAGVLGLMVGWPAITLCLFFAILAGGLVSLVIILGMLIARKYQAFTAIPYAPFLVLSALVILFVL